MCEMSLKNGIPSKELNEQMGVVYVANAVRQGRLALVGQERRDNDKWVSACRVMFVTGARRSDSGKIT